MGLHPEREPFMIHNMQTPGAGDPTEPSDTVIRDAESEQSNMFKEQRKFIHQSLILQKRKMEDFKSLCEQYLEKVVLLRDSRRNSVAEELRHLIATLEIKLLMVSHQQESAAAQQSLLDLLFS
ncbi:hypothetical protein A6R68_24054 [Neotoma lepida]|uniref:XLR/SYCP3/FAM9 domain-containing protein n=1 Tax=Neotoma lepida TaxID=56216 RepID=A0A1A6HUQ0_NEOLE|nr:hypothetical protein A6R68_24054 [Neotoma lepida]